MDNTGTQALWPQMISALAAIDRELDLPDDGCNSLEQTLETIREMKDAAKEASDEIEFLRNEVGRLLASISAEGDILDWLLSRLPGNVIRDLVGVMSDTRDVRELRELIYKEAGLRPPNTTK